MVYQPNLQPPLSNWGTDLTLSDRTQTKPLVDQKKLKSSTALPKINPPIPRKWAGGCAVLIGGGPSLTDEQCETVEKYHQRGECYVLGVNDAYRCSNLTLDALYAADTRWWTYHYDSVKKTTEAPLFTQCITAAREHDLWHIPGAGKPTPPGLCTDPSHIHFGDNSGYQAINLAYHLGVTNIILLGYDFNKSGAHWFGRHPVPMNVNSNFGAWIPKFRPLADDLARLGVRVMNCSPGSALDAFPQMPINEALRWMKRPCFETLEWPE